MFGFERYNYDTFTRDLLMKHAVKTGFRSGPEPGEAAPVATEPPGRSAAD